MGAAIERPQLVRVPGDATPLQMFDRTVAQLGEQPLLYSHRSPIAATELARLVDGLARGLASHGIEAGARIALLMQNDPQFVLATLAAWRLGACTVPCNPMLRERELSHHLRDSGASALIALDELHEQAGRAAVARTPSVELVLSTAPCEPEAAQPLRPRAQSPDGTIDLIALAHEHADAPPGSTADLAAAELAAAELARTGAAAATAAGRFAAPSPQQPAVLTYTSGTTGPPKGAINTHANIAHSARIYRDWLGIDASDTILGIAPLYHVTGLTGHIGLCLASGAPIVLAHRFDPLAAARLVEHHRASVTVAAITAYVAIANDERARAHDLSSLRRAYSGGAPIAPSLVEEIASRLGISIRPVYGLTETTGPTNLAPPDVPAPVDPRSGALAVGLAASETQIRILDDDGRQLPTGEVGEVAISGPQVVPGYWGDPIEARGSIVDGEMRTGDVGLLDADGWLYLVDRRKDMIVASGFKVWPREVEDVLYEHEAVREAAAVGVPDAYRGETVWAYVSLKPGCSVAPEALIAHCRARLAAYKYPRVVHVLDELPKTPTGKILRRELRESAGGPSR